MTGLLTNLADIAEELCDARQHREPMYEWTAQRNRRMTRLIITTQAGLLDQLRESVHPVNTGSGNHQVPASRPPLQLEALDRLIAIQNGVKGWAGHLRIPVRDRLETAVWGLVGAAAKVNDDTRQALLGDMRRWRGWAAVMVGWSSPPLTPYIRCANSECGQLSTLRILPERRTALCSACGHVWDDTDGTFAALGTFIVAQADTAPPRLRLVSMTAGHGGWANRDGDHITAR